MNCTLIVNPLSRSGRSRRRLPGILSECHSSGIKTSVFQASSYSEIKYLSERANQYNDEIIVAVGGDGTINAVLNGFYDEEGKRNSNSKLGVIYTGTSPDFCKSYNICLDEKKAIQDLKSGASTPMIPGRIRFLSRNGAKKEETRYFACCTNVGIGASIARDSNRIRKYAGDFGGTFISMLKNLLVYKSKTLFLEIDHECHCIEKAVNISIGKTPYIASGIKVKEDHRMNGDGFYVLTASGLSILNFPGLVKQIYSGDIGGTDYLRLSMGNHISLCADDPDVEVEFDGDPAGYLPCSIGPAAEAVELICGGG